MSKLVSVIIINYSRNIQDKLTLECIESLVPQTYSNFEIIIVDNGSDSELYRIIRRKLMEFEEKIDIKIVRSERNLFFTGGNNKALKIANGKIICLLNNDTVVNKDFIQNMVDFLEKHPEAGFICPKIMAFDNKKMIWYGGGIINLANLKLVKLRGQWELDPFNQKYNSISETDFAASTSVFFTRELIKKIGKMDEIFMMYHDDPDWNLRAREYGYKNYYVPTTVVYHKVSRHKSRQYGLFNSYFVHRNLQILVLKHGNWKQIFFFYFKFIFVNFLEIFAYIGLSMIPKNFYQFLYERLNLPFRKKKNYLYATYMRYKALVQGFNVGLRRRTNRECKKQMIKQYKFILKHQKIIEKI